MSNPRLTPAAKLVYCCLGANNFQGDVVSITMRKIAEYCSLSLSAVNVAIGQLISEGVIVSLLWKGRSRRSYHLVSPVFAQKAGQVNEIVSGPGRRKRLANVELQA